MHHAESPSRMRLKDAPPNSHRSTSSVPHKWQTNLNLKSEFQIRTHFCWSEFVRPQFSLSICPTVQTKKAFDKRAIHEWQ